MPFMYLNMYFFALLLWRFWLHQYCSTRFFFGGGGGVWVLGFGLCVMYALSVMKASFFGGGFFFFSRNSC